MVSLCLISTIIALDCCHALETRTSLQSSRSAAQNGTSAGNTYNARLQKQPQFEGTCGNSDDLAKRVEVCAKPLMDLLQGTIEKWPRTNEDAKGLCDSVSESAMVGD